MGTTYTILCVQGDVMLRKKARAELPTANADSTLETLEKYKNDILFVKVLPSQAMLRNTAHSPATHRTPNHSPLTIHYSPLNTHHRRLTNHYSPLTTHYSLITTHNSLLTTHHSILNTHCSLLTTH